MASIFSSAGLSPLVVVVVVAAAALFFLWKQRTSGGSRRSKKGNSTQTLSRFSRDLTALAAENKLDPMIGREDELERLIQVLSRRTKNNPVMVGKSGVGKTAIAEGLAQAIVKKTVPSILRNKRVLALDLPSLIAGTKYRGEFEQRLKRIADEITQSNRSIILFIDEIHTLAEAGGAEGSIDADDILKPALARGDLQVIGATTIQEYKEFIQKDVTLDRRLHPIIIDEPDKKETTEILRGIKRKYEQFHKVNISDESIITAVHLAAEHMPGKSFPDKAIDLMDEAASKVNIAQEDSQKSNDNQKSWPVVGVAEIQAVMQEWLEQHDKI